MTICNVDTLVLFDPMSHSQQSYVAGVYECFRVIKLTLFLSGTPELVTMDLTASSHSFPSTTATMSAMGSNLNLCSRRKRTFPMPKMMKIEESRCLFLAAQ